MIRRDALTRRRAHLGRSGQDDSGTRPPHLHLELDPADHEEPTWEVRHPGDNRRRRMDRRTKAILSGAAIAAIVVNSVAAWLYWRITGSDTAPAGTSSVSMAVRARSDLDKPLRPGQTSNLAVTVANDYDFPIRITALTPSSGNIIADDEHREAGCRITAVSVTRPRFEVSWDVQRHTIGAFSVPDGLIMRPDADPSCVGAIFTVPVQVFGERRHPA